MTAASRIGSGVLTLALLFGAAGGAFAQSQPSGNAKPEAPMTPPAPGPSSGTAPGNEGSTGWSGGTGGSFTGTSNQSSMPGSKTEQPETAKGLNPQPTGTAQTPR